MKTQFIWGALLAAIAATMVSAAPQDYWYFEDGWIMPEDTNTATIMRYPHIIEHGPSNTLYVIGYWQNRLARVTLDRQFLGSTYNSGFDDVSDVCIDSNGWLWVSMNVSPVNDMRVFRPDLTHAFDVSLSNQTTYANGCDFNSQGELVVGNGAIVRVFDRDGNELRSWPTLNAVQLLDVGPDDVVYVMENDHVSLYTRMGEFIRRFSNQGGDNWMRVAEDGTVFIMGGTWIRAFDSHGRYLYLTYTAATPGSTGGITSNDDILVTPGGDLIMSGRDSGNAHAWIMRYRRSSYSFQPPQPEGVPSPRVVSVVQRPGIATLDMDYVVYDPDDATLHTAVYALIDDAASLDNFVPVSTLIEGTDANIGPGTPTGTVQRVTWDMASDFATNVANIAMHVMARDTTPMLSFDFITIPSNGPDPELTINRLPIRDNQFLPLWFWLLAAADSDLGFAGGEVTGSLTAPPAYRGQRLADGTTTTEDGRNYLFERLGVRVATAAELTRAREGSTPGTVNEFAPRAQMERDLTTLSWMETPDAINEYGFDTSYRWEQQYPGAHWFVVKTP